MLICSKCTFGVKYTHILIVSHAPIPQIERMHRYTYNIQSAQMGGNGQKREASEKKLELLIAYYYYYSEELSERVSRTGPGSLFFSSDEFSHLQTTPSFSCSISSCIRNIGEMWTSFNPPHHLSTCHHEIVSYKPGKLRRNSIFSKRNQRCKQ